MISHHDIEAFAPELSDGAEDDAVILDEVERRVTLGVAEHREMTQAESLSVLRMAVRYRKYWSLRVKGYKAWDEYANAKQFPQQTEGASGAAVINPLSTSIDDRCRLFASIEAGAEYLQHMRARAA